MLVPIAVMSELMVSEDSERCRPARSTFKFEGQTKTKLGNTEIRPLVQNAVTQGLAEYLEENPTPAKRIIGKATQALKAREAARKARAMQTGALHVQDLAAQGQDSLELTVAGLLRGPSRPSSV
mgnify:CR=1 FL=1